MGLSIRRLHVGFFAIGAGLLAAPANAQQSLTVAVYGGEWGDALQSCILEPFAKANNIKVTPEPGVSTVTLANCASRRAPQSSMLPGSMAASPSLRPRRPCRRVSMRRRPEIANMIPEGVYKTSAGEVYALSTGFYSLGLVYNTKEVKTPPASFWDLWKPEFANVSTMPSPVNAMGVPLFMHLNKARAATPATTNPR